MAEKTGNPASPAHGPDQPEPHGRVRVPALLHDLEAALRSTLGALGTDAISKVLNAALHHDVELPHIHLGISNSCCYLTCNKLLHQPTNRRRYHYSCRFHAEDPGTGPCGGWSLERAGGPTRRSRQSAVPTSGRVPLASVAVGRFRVRVGLGHHHRPVRPFGRPLRRLYGRVDMG